jgi:hypothetical protein
MTQEQRFIESLRILIAICIFTVIALTMLRVVFMACSVEQVFFARRNLVSLKRLKISDMTLYPVDTPNFLFIQSLTGPGQNVWTHKKHNAIL